MGIFVNSGLDMTFWNSVWQKGDNLNSFVEILKITFTHREILIKWGIRHVVQWLILWALGNVRPRFEY